MAEAGLFDGVLARGRVREAVGDAAWLQAMLDAEAALARASAEVGLISAADAETIASACGAAHYDAAQLGEQAASSGNPAVPLVKALTSGWKGPAAGHVHSGATSQDIVDTAAMLVAHRAAGAAPGRPRGRLGRRRATRAGAPRHPARRPDAAPAGRSGHPRAEGGGLAHGPRRRDRPPEDGPRGAPRRAARRRRRHPRLAGRSRRRRHGGHGTGPRTRTAGAPVAHDPHPARGARGRAGHGLRRRGEDRPRRHAPGPDRGGGGRRGRGGRLLDDAAQAQPRRGDQRRRVRRAGARARRDAPRRDGARARARGRELARRVASVHRAAALDGLRRRMAAHVPGGAGGRRPRDAREPRPHRRPAARRAREHRARAGARAHGGARGVQRAAAAGGSFAEALAEQPEIHGRIPAERLAELLDPSGYLGSTDVFIDRALAAHDARRPARDREDFSRSRPGRRATRSQRCDDLHHVIDGPADAPAVVLFPSLGSTLELWEPQVAALAEHFRVDPRRPARARRIAGPAGAVHDRRHRRRRRRAARPPRHRARPRRRRVARRDGRHVDGDQPPGSRRADRARRDGGRAAGGRIRRAGRGGPGRRHRRRGRRRARALADTGGPGRRPGARRAHEVVGARHAGRGLRRLLRGDRRHGPPRWPAEHHRPHARHLRAARSRDPARAPGPDRRRDPGLAAGRRRRRPHPERRAARARHAR